MRRIFSRRNERGSTILEVIVALFVLSSLGVGAWQAVSVSLRLSSRIRDAMLSSARLISLDDQLRGLAARVLPPYWAPEAIVSIGDGTLEAAYLDGDPSRRFTVTFAEKMLSVGDGATMTEYRDFQSIEVSAALGRDGRLFGITLDAVGKNGRRTVVMARFGGHSLADTRLP